MPLISSIFLCAAVILAVLIGPQTRAWTWGPSMVALGIAVGCALPVLWRERRKAESFGMIFMGAAVVIWFAIRCFTSPVWQFAQSDLLLAGGAVATFVCFRAIQPHGRAVGLLQWVLALLLLASALVAFKQAVSPGYTPLFRLRPDRMMVSGFFAHYNEAANYFIVSSLLVASAALMGKHRLPTRIFFLLIAAAGMTSVFLTHSRGGILAAAIGSAAFCVLLLIIGARRRARWFMPAIFGIPIVGVAIVIFLTLGWQAAQERRNSGTEKPSISRMFDNSSRLYFLGVAFSCIQQHPFIGGGSRSFSWECRQFMDAQAQGDTITHRPEQVHNELVQATTDYGIIGGVLVFVLLAGVAIRTVVILFVDDSLSQQGTQAAWLLGGLSALAGMLTQSSFSFVFHLMPGTMFLGLCLGQLSLQRGGNPIGTTAIASKAILTIAGIAFGGMLLFYGYKGTRLTGILWNSYFASSTVAPPAERLGSLDAALRIWPQSELFQEKAMLLQSLEASPDAAVQNQDLLENAMFAYESAAEMDPTDPAFPINRGNLLSKLGRDEEAEQAYQTGITLQGGMEPAFRGYFCLAGHLLRKGLRQSASGDVDTAHKTLESAADQIEEAERLNRGILQDMYATRVAIHESLGMAREASGDLKGALASYTLASSLYNGGHVYYRMGVLLGRMAEEAYFGRRPSEALTLYMKANRMANLSKQLPVGVGPSQRAEFNSVLQQRIQSLKVAKIEPAAE